MLKSPGDETCVTGVNRLVHVIGHRPERKWTDAKLRAETCPFTSGFKSIFGSERRWRRSHQLLTNMNL
ncbi:unnamed protein product [Pleuronectes platessa]|uniref:Uncharacterized protein n=1 Tax=Pleuronectes platessa TaxID=8262 RepID=A0A9N7YQT0_PLEPL|nr:unnamed protein product [Pleuronectes platessa]